jgi:hypothetical protein
MLIEDPELAKAHAGLRETWRFLADAAVALAA